jgi:hypothetical protein
MVRSIGQMIRDKLRHEDKLKQFNSRLVPRIGGNKTKNNLSISFNNHWLARFIQGDGSFQIQINNRNLKSRTQTQIMVVIQISQKKD